MEAAGLGNWFRSSLVDRWIFSVVVKHPVFCAPAVAKNDRSIPVFEHETVPLAYSAIAVCMDDLADVAVAVAVDVSSLGEHILPGRRFDDRRCHSGLGRRSLFSAKY